MLPALVLLLTWCSALAAGTDSDLRELIAAMNFEQAPPAGQDLPKGWDQVTLSGPDIPENTRFPHYLSGRVTSEYSTEGGHSFMLSLDGGNLAYAYTDRIEASSEYDYLLTGMLRTDLLQVARAQVRMQLLDSAGQPIAASLVVSRPMGAPGGPYDNRWAPFVLKLTGSFPAADALSISLALVQPEIWRKADKLYLDRQDIKGLCWWDDLKVYRLPRVSLRTSSPTNTFEPGSPRSLIALTEGLNLDSGGTVLTVRDSDGAVMVRRIVGRAEQADGLVRVDLPRLPAGLYTAELTVSNAGAASMARRIDFAVLPTIPQTDRRGPIIDATAMTPSHWDVLPRMAAAVDASGVILSAWPPSQADMQAIVDRLNAQGVAVTVAWDHMPGFAPVDQGGSHGDLMRSLAEDETWLRDDIQLMLAEYAGSVDAWQLGGDGDVEMVWSRYLQGAYELGSTWVDQLIAGKRLLLSWDGSVAYDLPDKAPLTIRIDNGIQPWLIPDQVEEFGDRAARVYLPISEVHGRSQALLDDYALRYAYARAAGVEGVVTPPPWKFADDGSVLPDPLLLTARTLAGWLGDASFIGSSRLDDRRTAIMFKDHDGRGIMFIHALADAAAMPTLEMEFPPGARLVDLRGRSIPLTYNGTRAVLPDWTGAYMITGCDADTLAIRSSMKFTPDIIEGEYRDQQVDFSVDNPFPSPMVGEVAFTPPAGWVITPPNIRFSIEPGGSWTTPLTVRFPFAADTDLHKIHTRMQVYRGREMTLSAPLLLRIQSENLHMDTYAALTDSGLLEVQLCIINNGEKPVSVNCFVKAVGRPQLRAIVNELKPDTKVFKQFLLKNGRQLTGTELKTGLREIDGPRIINQTTPIH